MNSGKIEISLCMGSSCFARGNNRLLNLLEEQIGKNGWGDRIALSGARCGELCGEGPVIRIDGRLYRGLDEGALFDLIQDLLAIPHGNTSRFSVRKSTSHLS